MKKRINKFMSVMIALAMSSSTVAVNATTIKVAEPSTETTTEQARTINNQYNIFDFLKSNMPETPELRFDGTTVEQYNQWSKKTKAKLKEVMGIDKLEASKMEPTLLETKVMDGYTRYKYEIKTTNDLSMPYYVLVPKQNANGKAAIAIHGHGSDGKEGLVGNEKEDLKSSVEKYHYTYAMELLNKGYTVYVLDLLGAGERMLGIYKNNTAECNDINNALISLGYSLQGMILFENMRLTDYIATLGYDEIDCIGFSGGGEAALWLSVMDDNVSKTVVSGFLHSFKDTLIYNNRCGCNFVPNMWKYVDMGDILALDANKEIYIETGDKDGLNGERGLEGVYEQVKIANKCFSLFNKEVQLNVCNGSHQWYGSWMEKF